MSHKEVSALQNVFILQGITSKLNYILFSLLSGAKNIHTYGDDCCVWILSPLQKKPNPTHQHLYNLLEKHTHTHTHICERNLFRITFSSRTCCCFLNFTSTFLELKHPAVCSDPLNTFWHRTIQIWRRPWRNVGYKNWKHHDSKTSKTFQIKQRGTLKE